MSRHPLLPIALLALANLAGLGAALAGGGWLEGVAALGLGVSLGAIGRAWMGTRRAR